MGAITISGVAQHKGGGSRIYMLNAPNMERVGGQAIALTIAADNVPALAGGKKLRIYGAPIVALTDSLHDDFAGMTSPEGAAITAADIDKANTTIWQTTAKFRSHSENSETFLAASKPLAGLVNPSPQLANVASDLHFPFYCSGLPLGVVLRSEQWNAGNTAKENATVEHDEARLIWRLTLV